MPYYRCPECGLITHSVAALSEDWAVACGPDGCTVRCAVAGWPASAGKRTRATQSGTWLLAENAAQ